MPIAVLTIQITLTQRVMRFWHRAIKSAVWLLAFWGTPVQAQDRVHIWLKAFLPATHSGNPGYITSVPGNRSVLPDPLPGSSACFATDHRGFSPDPGASARGTVEFDMVVASNNVTIAPSGPAAIMRIGPTHKVDCNTGSDLEPPRTASVEHMNMGAPAFADGVAQVVIDGRIGNPFVPVGSAFHIPDINWGGTFTFDVRNRHLRFQGSTGIFPAFEAYAQLNGGPVQTLFRHDPDPGTTAINGLIEGGTGFRQRAIDVTVQFPDDPLAKFIGSWKGTYSFKVVTRTGRPPQTMSYPFTVAVTRSGSGLSCAATLSGKDESCSGFTATGTQVSFKNSSSCDALIGQLAGDAQSMSGGASGGSAGYVRRFCSTVKWSLRR